MKEKTKNYNFYKLLSICEPWLKKIEIFETNRLSDHAFNPKISKTRKSK